MFVIPNNHKHQWCLVNLLPSNIPFWEMKGLYHKALLKETNWVFISPEFLEGFPWPRGRFPRLNCPPSPQKGPWNPCALRSSPSPSHHRLFARAPRGFSDPKSSILMGFSIINHPFFWYPSFWKHPYGLLLCSLHYCWWFVRNPARKPVEGNGSWNPHFFTTGSSSFPRWLGMGFL